MKQSELQWCPQVWWQVLVMSPCFGTVLSAAALILATTCAQALFFPLRTQTTLETPQNQHLSQSQ